MQNSGTIDGSHDGQGPLGNRIRDGLRTTANPHGFTKWQKEMMVAMFLSVTGRFRVRSAPVSPVTLSSLAGSLLPGWPQLSLHMHLLISAFPKMN